MKVAPRFTPRWVMCKGIPGSSRRGRRMAPRCRVAQARTVGATTKKGSENFSGGGPQAARRFKRKCSLTPFCRVSEPDPVLAFLSLGVAKVAFYAVRVGHMPLHSLPVFLWQVPIREHMPISTKLVAVTARQSRHCAINQKTMNL